MFLSISRTHHFYDFAAACFQQQQKEQRDSMAHCFACIYFLACLFVSFWSYGHMAESLVSTPVVGFVPFISGRSHIRTSVLVGNCASVKSAFSTLLASMMVAPK